MQSATRFNARTPVNPGPAGGGDGSDGRITCFNARTPVNPGPAAGKLLQRKFDFLFQRSDPGQPGARKDKGDHAQDQRDVSTLGPRSTRGPLGFAGH